MRPSPQRYRTEYLVHDVNTSARTRTAMFRRPIDRGAHRPRLMRAARHTVIVAAAAAMLDAAGCGSSGSGGGGQSGSPLSIKWAWSLPDDNGSSKENLAIIDTLQKSGKFTVTKYPAGSLVSENGLQNAVRNHTVDLVTDGIHHWNSVNPAFSLDEVPFLIDDLDKVQAAVQGKLTEDMNKMLKPYDSIILGWTLYGFGGDFINNKHPVKKPEDLNGLALRSNDPLSSAWIKKFGGRPESLDSADVYTAIQRGRVSGATSGIDSFVKRDWVGVAKYITSTRASAALYPVMANLKWWNGITEDQRSAIKDAISQHQKEYIKVSADEYDKDVAAAKSKGATVFKVEGPVRDEWKQGASFVRDLYLKQAGAEGKTLIADVTSGSGS